MVKRHESFKRYFWVLLLGLQAFSIHSQDVEQVLKAPPFKMSGQISAGVNYISDPRLGEIKSPFGYLMSAGVNLSFFGVLNIPLSFTYGDQQRTFNRPPLRITGLSPSYKWLTLHGGYRTYQLSPYLMQGTTVLGGGIEINPGKFQLLVFAGDIVSNYGVPQNQLSFLFNEEIEFYKRKTYGFKIGVGSYNNFINLSYFNTTDQKNTGSTFLLDSLFITPIQNSGAALSLGLNLFKRLQLKSNFTANLMTSNTREESILNEEDIPNILKRLLQGVSINNTSSYGFAYDAEAQLNLGSVVMGFQFQHVDPNYTSAGLAYLQPNVRNYTFNLSSNFSKIGVFINGNLGYQFNNSGGNFAQTDKRVIANLNLSWQILNNLNLNGNYNNFNGTSSTNFTEVRDSLRITTNNEGYNANLAFNTGTKDLKHNLNFSFNQNTFNIIQFQELSDKNTSSQVTFSYTVNHKPSKLSFGLNSNYSNFENPGNLPIQRIGAGLNIRKSFNQKFNAGLSTSYNLNFTGGENDGYVMNYRLNTSMKLSEKQSISFNSSYMIRNTKLINAFNQASGALQYNLNF